MVSIASILVALASLEIFLGILLGDGIVIAALLAAESVGSSFGFATDVAEAVGDASD